MGRGDAITSHLPTLYREGELVDGFSQLWGVGLDVVDEVAQQIQRSHWFDVTPDLDEAAALAAVLDIPPEDFHATLGEYRAWVHALTAARLRAGAVTRDALRILVDTYAQGFSRAAGLTLPTCNTTRTAAMIGARSAVLPRSWPSTSTPTRS